MPGARVQGARVQGALAIRPSRPHCGNVNTIVAASAESFRARMRETLLEAVADDISTAETPHALSVALTDSSDPVVITGDEWQLARPFVRAAVDAGAPTLLVLDPWATSVAEQALAAGARAVLRPPTGTLAPALAAVRAGLVVLSESPGRLHASESIATARSAELARYQGRSAATDGPLRDEAPRALTNRERQILSLIAAGTSNKGIARSLGVSANTVKFHLGAAFEKLHVTTRAEAVAAAIRRGELSL